MLRPFLLVWRVVLQQLCLFSSTKLLYMAPVNGINYCIAFHSCSPTMITSSRPCHDPRIHPLVLPHQ